MIRRERTPAEHEAGVLRKWARHDDRMHWIERYGPSYIYPLGYDEIEISALRLEISKKLGLELPAPDIGLVSQDEGVWHEILDRTAVCGSCGGDDLMEFEHLHWFECEACHKPTPVVLGCLSCAHIRCPDCVPSRRRGAASLTPLSVIAESFEVTTARISAVLQGALRKLRHPSNARLLWPFVDWQVSDCRPSAPPRVSWTELALADAAQAGDAPESVSGTCGNCARGPEALRTCATCGGRICMNCSSWGSGAPTCASSWFSVDSCRARQAQRDLRDSHGPR
jgi:hypothetical protein